MKSSRGYASFATYDHGQENILTVYQDRNSQAHAGELFFSSGGVSPGGSWQHNPAYCELHECPA